MASGSGPLLNATLPPVRVSRTPGATYPEVSLPNSASSDDVPSNGITPTGGEPSGADWSSANASGQGNVSDVQVTPSSSSIGPWPDRASLRVNGRLRSASW